MNTMNYMEEIHKARLGLVFSGGGSKGSYEIGAWKALEELGIAGSITGVSGSSIGAFNTALFAQGDLDTAEYIWRDMRATDMVNINLGKIAEKFAQSEGATPKEAFLQNVRLVETGENAKGMMENSLNRLLDAAAGKLTGETAQPDPGGKGRLSSYAIWAAQNLFGDGFATPEKLIGILRKYVNFETVRNSNLDLYSTVCQWNPDTEVTGHARYVPWKEKSPEEILALIGSSMALPVLYPHGEQDDEYYVDGGYADNIPVRPLYDLGYRSFIVIYLDKFVKKGRKKRIALEEELLPDARFLRIFPDKNFDYSFVKSCTITPEKTEECLRMGYEDTLEMLHPVV